MEYFLLQLIAIAGFILFCWWLLFNKNKSGKYTFRFKDPGPGVKKTFLYQFIKLYGQLGFFALIIVILIFGLSGLLPIF